MTETQDNRFHFELVSPAKRLMEMPVFQVTVPGQDGDFGIRKGHESFIVSMRPGVIEILKEKNTSSDFVPERFFVAGGFVDISSENCTVLAEEAILVTDLDRATIEAEIVSIESHLVAEAVGGDQKQLSRDLHVAQAKLKAL